MNEASETSKVAVEKVSPRDPLLKVIADGLAFLREHRPDSSVLQWWDGLSGNGMVDYVGRALRETMEAKDALDVEHTLSRLMADILDLTETKKRD